MIVRGVIVGDQGLGPRRISENDYSNMTLSYHQTDDKDGYGLFNYMTGMTANDLGTTFYLKSLVSHLDEDEESLIKLSDMVEFNGRQKFVRSYFNEGTQQHENYVTSFDEETIQVSPNWYKLKLWQSKVFTDEERCCPDFEGNTIGKTTNDVDQFRSYPSAPVWTVALDIDESKKLESFMEVDVVEETAVTTLLMMINDRLDEEERCEDASHHRIIWRLSKMHEYED